MIVIPDPTNVERASSADYDSVFSSPAGRRVLNDLAIRYQVGGPSLRFNRNGDVNLEHTAVVDAAKEIIRDILVRAKFKPEQARIKKRKTKDDEPTRLPTAATHL